MVTRIAALFACGQHTTACTERPNIAPAHKLILHEPAARAACAAQTGESETTAGVEAASSGLVRYDANGGIMGSASFDDNSGVFGSRAMAEAMTVDRTPDGMNIRCGTKFKSSTAAHQKHGAATARSFERSVSTVAREPATSQLGHSGLMERHLL